MNYFKQLLVDRGVNTELVDAVANTYDQAVQMGLGSKMLPELYQLFKVPSTIEK
ncbi:hypothetical protein [Paenibacillus hexagrammi]|uniref:Uncharacterized protein n=1 Tax=Paenibacillus hexagrammi TaxID=2908839 RepID=A0ABY3SNK7_9BACL|nr:hypothetical protein [Paenibacillus sp. YPD9-1]UJF35531.1 hypothetical protein L0M14_10760 [Paenibacillus sp. YPD9-1]